VYGELDAGEQDRARRALVQLVRPGEGTEDTRRLAAREEMEAENWTLIRHLADRRLVVTGRDAAGARDGRSGARGPDPELGAAAELDGGRPCFPHLAGADAGRAAPMASKRPGRRRLVAGYALIEAEQWLADRPAELSQAEREFIQAGVVQREAAHQRELEAAQKLAESEGRRAEDQAQAARRLRRRAFLLAGASVLAAVLAAIAFLAFRQANQNAESAQAAGALAERQQTLAEEQLQLATSRELAAAAVANLYVDPERSVLLALEALSSADTLEARNALHRRCPSFVSCITQSLMIWSSTLSRSARTVAGWLRLVTMRRPRFGIPRHTGCCSL